jgi:hypothetical protein
LEEVTTTTTEALTMTPREIAELTGKRHDHVMRDLGVMFSQLGDEGGASKFGDSYLSEQNKLMPMLQLPKRETMILVSGDSVTLRAKIVDRWQELEAQVVQPLVPTTLTGALWPRSRANGPCGPVGHSGTPEPTVRNRRLTGPIAAPWRPPIKPTHSDDAIADAVLTPSTRRRGAQKSTDSLTSQTNEGFPMSSMRALPHQAAQDRRIGELTPPPLLRIRPAKSS